MAEQRADLMRIIIVIQIFTCNNCDNIICKICYSYVYKKILDICPISEEYFLSKYCKKLTDREVSGSSIDENEGKYGYGDADIYGAQFCLDCIKLDFL